MKKYLIGNKNIWVLLTTLIVMFMVTGCGQEKSKGPSGASATLAVVNSPSVWVINNDLMDAAVYRIDPATNKQIAKIPFEGAPGGIVVTAEGVWVTDYANDKLVRIDPATNKVQATVNTEKGPRAVVASPGAIWVANSLVGTVTRVDPSTSQVVATINVTNSALNSLYFVDDALWVSGTDFTVYKIDVQTNQVVAKINVGTLPGEIAGKSGTLWVAAPVANQLLRIDLNSKKVDMILKTDNSTAIALLQDTVAVANKREGTVSLVNMTGNNAKQDIKVGNNLGAISSGYGSLWAISNDDDALYRIDPISKSVVATISIKRASKVAVGLDGK